MLLLMSGNPEKCGKSVELDQKHVTDKFRKIYIIQKTCSGM